MPIERLGEDGFVCTGSAIELYRLLALRGALRLEVVGLRSSRGSVAPQIRDLLKTKTRDKAALMNEFEVYIGSVKHGLATS